MVVFIFPQFSPQLELEDEKFDLSPAFNIIRTWDREEGRHCTASYNV